MKPRVVLKRGRSKSVTNKHPWVFSGAIQDVSSGVADGDLVEVHSASGEPLAKGFLNRRSQIAVRVVTWEPDQAIDGDFWRARLGRAIEARSVLRKRLPETDALRLVNAESDGLPGLIVDQYDNWLVAQFLSLGMELRKQTLVQMLGGLLPGLAGIFERSDVDVRRKEGLALSSGPLVGPAPPDRVIIREHGLRFEVDLIRGHKTGFYLDQRPNRAIAESCAEGLDILNCFAFTGAFSVYAARGNARRIVNVEASSNALEWASRNMDLNGFKGVEAEYVTADVFRQLREFRDAGTRFDLVILDPPKFAHSKATVKRATRGYKDINWLAMRLLRPGGTLLTFSCSGQVSMDLFQKILFGAALDAGRDVQITQRMAQGEDHPVLLSFPEGAYLKGVVCRVW